MLSSFSQDPLPIGIFSLRLSLTTKNQMLETRDMSDDEEHKNLFNYNHASVFQRKLFKHVKCIQTTFQISKPTCRLWLLCSEGVGAIYIKANHHIRTNDKNSNKDTEILTFSSSTLSDVTLNRPFC